MKRYQSRNKITFQNKQNLHSNLNIFKLKKKKWFFIKKKLINNFFIKKRKKIKLIKPENKKDLFKERLYIKQQLKFFYGDLPKIQLKILILKYFKKVKIKNKNSFQEFFCFLETRLDILLVRLYIAKSIFHAKQLINHKKIKVNNKVLTSNFYFLNPGDIISFQKLAILKLKKNLVYVEYNKYIKQITFLRKPRLNEITYPFPSNFSFFLDCLKN